MDSSEPIFSRQAVSAMTEAMAIAAPRTPIGPIAAAILNAIREDVLHDLTPLSAAMTTAEALEVMITIAKAAPDLKIATGKLKMVR